MKKLWKLLVYVKKFYSENYLRVEELNVFRLFDFHENVSGKNLTFHGTFFMIFCS